VLAGAPVSGRTDPSSAEAETDGVLVVGTEALASMPRMPLSLQIAGSPQADVPGDEVPPLPGTVPSAPEPLLPDEPPAPVPGPWPPW
jgi:hypothetical protein